MKFHFYNVMCFIFLLNSGFLFDYDARNQSWITSLLIYNLKIISNAGYTTAWTVEVGQELLFFQSLCHNQFHTGVLRITFTFTQTT